MGFWYQLLCLILTELLFYRYVRPSTDASIGDRSTFRTVCSIEMGIGDTYFFTYF